MANHPVTRCVPPFLEKEGRIALSLLALAAFSFGITLAEANPLGPQVVNGQASFVQQGNTLSITNAPNTIINWQGFSIDAGELTRFIQQNPNSSVLNRIVGQDPSRILGALQSNGRVLLINPNGVIFGAGARVDVNGLVASTLNLSNQDFLAGKLNFTAGDKSASIQNQGAITTPSGGQVYLIAPNAENSGLITSPQGDVVLAAGHTVKLVDSANPDLHVVVSANDNRAVNVGQIVAQGGRIGIYGALINQRGIVNANSLVVGQNGKIVFKASRDTVLEAGSQTSATGAGKGGEIQILGERVALTGNASVDASGQGGGGTVLIGGDYQGKNPDIPNATQTYMNADARIAADAVQSGNGGKIIVWSNDVTRAHGSISARGGAVSGDGGFVEVSGHYLDMQGNVDTRAPNGATGTLLLDPTNIYIALNQANANAAGMTGSDSSASTGPPPFVAAGSVSDSLLSVGTLQSVLASSSVVVSTANASDTGAGAITVVDPVSWSSAHSLSLMADSDIRVNAAISGPAAAVTLSAPTGAIIGNGLITAASLTAVASGGIGQGTPLQTQVASLNLTNTGSDTFIRINNIGPLNITGATQTFANGVGTISVTSSGSMTVSGSVASSRGDITLDAGSSGTTANQLTVGSSGSVLCDTGNILVKAGGAIVTVGAVSSTGGTVTLQQNLGTSVELPPMPLPPEVLSPVLPAPVQQVVNLVTVRVVYPPLTPMPSTVNSSVIVAPASAPPADTQTSGVQGTAATTDASAKTDEKTADKKEDMKEDKKDDLAKNDKSGTKNEPSKKMYCN